MFSSACAASIARLVTLVDSALDPNDWTYNFIAPSIWNIIEPTVGIVSACLPMLRPLFQFLHSKISSLGRRASARKYPSSAPVIRPSPSLEATANSPLAIAEDRQAWSSPTSTSDTVTTTTSERWQPHFELLMSNRSTPGEQIRRKHASWLAGTGFGRFKRSEFSKSAHAKRSGLRL
ncbi:MAG: hypothetical protein Q9214_007773 [Letrouitia sp. 1 TL-2023]